MEPKNPGFGRMYGGPAPTYVTDPNRVEVWMWRKGQRVRFYDVDGNQIGPEHRNVAPAIVWAANEGWIDPDNVSLSCALNVDVRRLVNEQKGHA